MPKKASDALLDEVSTDFRKDVENAIEGFDEEGRIRILTAIQSRLAECRSLVHKTVFEMAQTGSILSPPENTKDREVLLTRLENLPWTCNKTTTSRIVGALNEAGVFFVYEAIKSGSILIEEVPGFHLKGMEYLRTAIRRAGVDMNTINIPLGMQIQLEKEIKIRKLL